MEKNTTDSQKKRILRYLLNGNSLTPLDALNLFGCFRLVEHNGKRFAEYYFFDWEVTMLKSLYEKGFIRF